MIPWRQRHSISGKPVHAVVLHQLPEWEKFLSKSSIPKNIKPSRFSQVESDHLCPAHIADLWICLWHQILREKCNTPFRPQVTFTFQAKDGTPVGVLQVDFLHQLIGTPDPMNWTLSPRAFDRLQTIALECRAYRELI